MVSGFEVGRRLVGAKDLQILVSTLYRGTSMLEGWFYEAMSVTDGPRTRCHWGLLVVRANGLMMPLNKQGCNYHLAAERAGDARQKRWTSF